MRSMHEYKRKDECLHAVSWQMFYDHKKEESYYFNFISKSRKSRLNRKVENLRIAYAAIAETTMIEVFEVLGYIAREDEMIPA